MRVGVIGAGIMGGAMAANLAAAGHEVVAFDVDRSKLEDLSLRGVAPAAGVAGLAARSEVAILSLPSVDALAVVTDELAASGVDDLTALETGTLPLAAKLEARDRLAESGIELMDVPLSGTGLQAADATLVIFASGTEQAYQRCLPIFEAIGRSSHYLGGFGHGSTMKFIANLLVAIHTLAAAEAHVLGLASGLDPEVVQEVMEDGVGSSKMFEIRGPMMVADDYPPAARLDIILKDVSVISEYARSVGAPTPLLDSALVVYRKASAGGLGELDAAALCRHLEHIAGLTR